ncbi:MAG TPA: hypothetical protein VG224_08985 [Reyranella sp.]|nr:hypothetical protein [Reyranella sp.]
MGPGVTHQCVGCSFQAALADAVLAKLIIGR